MRPSRSSIWRPALAAAACLLGSGVLATGALAGLSAAPDLSTHARKPLEIATAPPIPGLQFVFRGQTFVTDENGVIVIPRELLPSGGAISRRLRVIQQLSLRPVARGAGVVYRIERFYAISAGKARRTIRAAVDAYLPVRFAFVDRFGKPVDLRLLDSVTMKRSDGALITLSRKRLRGPARSFQASRVVPLSGALVSKKLDYRIQSVLVGGNNVVNRAQQAFTPLRRRVVTVQLLLYSARVSARDVIFGFGIGSGVRLEYPDGRVQHHRFSDGHRLLLPALPRGAYHIGVDAAGISGSQPVSITRDQVVQLKVLSYLDIAFAILVLVAVAVGLVAIGRRRAHHAPAHRLAPPVAPPVHTTPPRQTIAPRPARHQDGA